MGDALLGLLRAAHGLTAAVWLGLALVGAWNPALLSAARGAGGWSARAVAQTSWWALLVTGAALMLDRLADPSGVSGPYVALLGLKLGCVAAIGVLGMVGSAADSRSGAERAQGWRSRMPRERVLLGLGLVAFELGSILTSVYEAALRGG
jgi:hypothetical protein